MRQSIGHCRHGSIGNVRNVRNVHNGRSAKTIGGDFGEVVDVTRLPGGQ
jgi:hypothetical protein